MPAEPDASAEEHRDNRTQDVGSQLQSGHGRWLNLFRLPVGQAFGIFGERRFGTTPLNMGNPSPSPMVQERRAKPGADSTTQRHSRRKDLRPVCSRPNAKSPIGRASDGGASRGRSRHAPALGADWRQARSRWVWAEELPPVPTRPQALPRLRMQELLRAYEPLPLFGD